MSRKHPRERPRGEQERGSFRTGAVSLSRKRDGPIAVPERRLGPVRLANELDGQGRIAHLATMIPFSVLDLAPIVEGGDAGQALRHALDLARHAERLGYRRFWMGRHQ